MRNCEYTSSVLKRIVYLLYGHTTFAVVLDYTPLSDIGMSSALSHKYTREPVRNYSKTYPSTIRNSCQNIRKILLFLEIWIYYALFQPLMYITRIDVRVRSYDATESVCLSLQVEMKRSQSHKKGVLFA